MLRSTAQQLQQPHGTQQEQRKVVVHQIIHPVRISIKLIATDQRKQQHRKHGHFPGPKPLQSALADKVPGKDIEIVYRAEVEQIHCRIHRRDIPQHQQAIQCSSSAPEIMRNSGTPKWLNTVTTLFSSDER